MPRIRTHATKKAPEGFDKISPTLNEFAIQLKEAESEKGSKLSSKNTESTWQVFQIHHERSRYVYNLFYKRKAISRELYEWLLREKYADKQLIAKWKKNGYEKLCCLQCIQSNETTNGKTCICRVPRATLEANAAKKKEPVTFKQCIHCGCSGCASSD
ncbi:Bud31 [Kluyveromyces lactis]|nr:Bud31 [Kluyveromyces lactis]